MNRKRYLTDKKNVILISMICCILWGSAFPVLKISYAELNMKPGDMCAKIVFAGIRFLIASLILFFILIVFIKKNIKINKIDLLKCTCLGILQTTLQYFFFYNGLDNTTGMKGAIIGSSGTFFVVIFAHIVYIDDKINFKKIIGLITGFAGIVLINLGKGFDVHFSFCGEGFLIISALVGAFGTIIAKKLAKNMHPFIVTAYQMLIGSNLLLIIGVPMLKPQAINFTLKGWILLVYASLLSASAFSLWYSLLKYNKAGEICLYKFIIPVSGSILSAIFIPGESFKFKTIIALLLVALGITVVNYSPSNKILIKDKKTYKL